MCLIMTLLPKNLIKENGNEIGQMFIKKSPYREGYLDAITKIG